MSAEQLAPDRLDLLLSGRAEPATPGERQAVRMASLLPRLQPGGPSPAASNRMAVRFDAFLERDGHPAGFAGYLPGWLARPAAQRIAAAAVILGGLGAGGAAAGYSPIDAARDAGSIAASAGDTLVNAIRNLDPTRDPSDAPGAVESPSPAATPSPETTPESTPSATASVTPGPSPTQSSEPPGDALHTVPVLDAGNVTVRRQGQSLEIVSVEPAPGWTYEVESPAGERVEVTFRQDSRTVDVRLELEDGVVEPDIDDSRDDDDSPTDDEGDES